MINLDNLLRVDKINWMVCDQPKTLCVAKYQLMGEEITLEIKRIGNKGVLGIRDHSFYSVSINGDGFYEQWRSYECAQGYCLTKLNEWINKKIAEKAAKTNPIKNYLVLCSDENHRRILIAGARRYLRHDITNCVDDEKIMIGDCKIFHFALTSEIGLIGVDDNGAYGMVGDIRCYYHYAEGGKNRLPKEFFE